MSIGDHHKICTCGRTISGGLVCEVHGEKLLQESRVEEMSDNICKHKWVNVDGCLLCGMNWSELNKEGFVFIGISPTTEKDIKNPVLISPSQEEDFKKFLPHIPYVVNNTF